MMNVIMMLIFMSQNFYTINFVTNCLLHKLKLRWMCFKTYFSNTFTQLHSQLLTTDNFFLNYGSLDRIIFTDTLKPMLVHDPYRQSNFCLTRNCPLLHNLLESSKLNCLGQLIPALNSCVMRKHTGIALRSMAL